MRRRALRQQNFSADLSAHYQEMESLAAGWNVLEAFSAEQPLEVELGSGKGLFINRAARENPQRNYLGLEIRRKYAQYSALRLKRGDLSNAMILQGDGLSFCKTFLPTGSVSTMHVYFPDPWWKRKHRKRRVFQARFIADVVRVLVPAGNLYFWTDVKEYFESTLELLSDFDQLKGPLKVVQHEPQFEMDYRTHFERRTCRHQEPVYRSEFIRVPATPTPVAHQMN